MPSKDVEQSRQLLTDLRTITEADTDTFDGLRLNLSQRFDLTPANFRALVSPIDGAGDADDPFRDDQLTGSPEQIGKDDHFGGSLQIFHREIGHPIALLRQHRFDRGDDAADLYLAAVGAFLQSHGRGSRQGTQRRFIAGERMGGNIEPGQFPFVLQSLRLIPFRKRRQRRNGQGRRDGLCPFSSSPKMLVCPSSRSR